MLQPDHGALTEAGHLAHGTPIVYENRNSHGNSSFGSLSGGGSEAARLATLRAQLGRAVERGDERGRTSAEASLVHATAAHLEHGGLGCSLEALGLQAAASLVYVWLQAQLLRTSHKESLFSFVFRDEASLQAPIVT